MRLIRRPLALLALCFALAGRGGAEIYRWTDAEGHEHFTQDLARVPPGQRTAASSSARQETRSAAPPATASASAPPARRTRSPRGGPFEIPFEKAGNTMLVYARVNDRVTAPFLVDTGASDVLIPAQVAQAAGIAVGRDTPHDVYQTANGLVKQPIVTIDAMQVGDARVEQLRGSVTSGMEVGLLGGTFFNNFTFQVDPAANIITLYPNASVKAGANAQEWRARFTALRERIAELDRYLAENVLTDDARVADLERRRAALGAELEALDAEADRAEVPQAWRE